MEARASALGCEDLQIEFNPHYLLGGIAAIGTAKIPFAAPRKPGHHGQSGRAPGYQLAGW